MRVLQTFIAHTRCLSPFLWAPKALKPPLARDFWRNRGQHSFPRHFVLICKGPSRFYGPFFANVCVLTLKMTPCLLLRPLTSSDESARHFGLKARYLRHFPLKRRCITMSQTLLLLAWPRLQVGRAAGDLHLKTPFPRQSDVNPPLGTLTKVPNTLAERLEDSDTLLYNSYFRALYHNFPDASVKNVKITDTCA